MIKEGLYPQVGYAGILQKFGKKSLCIRICQIGVFNLLKDGLRSFLSAAPCQKRTAKKCSGADKKSSTFQKWSPRCVFRKISLSAGVSTISEESNAVGLVTNGITDKQRKSMTSVVWFNPLRLPISKISCPTGCSGSQTSHPGTMRML